MPRDPLDSVYRLIASNSYLEAIHLINKLLKKQPNFLIAKVWKCEALHGLGNITESEELMAGILEQAPSDRRTLDSIADFYRARGNYSKLVEVYENALKNDPNDEGWRKALFECCGLAGDYKKQQQQALHLYKHSPRMLFYCMAVVCLLQQADNNPVALELAERMMAKQYSAGKLTSRNEIFLYIYVLESRGKIQEALEILEGNAAELDSLISTSDKRIELLTKLERWPNIVKELKTKLKDKPDHWMYLKQYVGAVLKLEQAGELTDSVDDDLDDSYTKARQFLESLCSGNNKLRGPYLAIIELVAVSGVEHAQDQLFDLIADYFDKFGSKAICVYDLSTYVTAVSEDKIPTLLAKLSTPDVSKLDQTKLQLLLGPLKHISFLQLSRLMGAHLNLSIEEREKLCASLEECYRVAGGCERSEHYPLIVTHERATLFRETGDAKHLLLAACVLEDAISKNNVFAFQVVLLQVYFILGDSKSARQLYEQLRIQSVQVDTLVHLFLCSISSTGHFTVASEMWDIAGKILHQCSAESLEALVWCYRAGLFHRVEEFTLCARRFQRTITVPLLRLEKVYLDVMSSEPGRAEQLLARILPPVNWDNCLDNRDLKALPSWEPAESQRPRDQSYSELIQFCKLREATLICLSAAISYGRHRKQTEENAFTSSLDRLRNLYSEAIAKSNTQYQVLNSCSTRLHLVAQVPLPSLLEKTMEPELSSCEKICCLLKQSTGSCVDVIRQNKAKNPRLSVETLVTEMEALAVMTVAAGAARGGATGAPAHRKRSIQLLQALQSSWQALEAALPAATIPACPEPASPPSRHIVEAKLGENYQLAAEEVRKVIKKKTSYIHKALSN